MCEFYLIHLFPTTLLLIFNNIQTHKSCIVSSFLNNLYFNVSSWVCNLETLLLACQALAKLDKERLLFGVFFGDSIYPIDMLLLQNIFLEFTKPIVQFSFLKNKLLGLLRNHKSDLKNSTIYMHCMSKTNFDLIDQTPIKQNCTCKHIIYSYDLYKCSKYVYKYPKPKKREQIRH